LLNALVLRRRDPRSIGCPMRIWRHALAVLQRELGLDGLAG
jgi:hypothetical protein